MASLVSDPAADDVASRHSVRSPTMFAALAIGVLLALQFHLVLTRTINWDETHFLTQVHDFARGELTVPLQTLHVRLFAWLPATDLLGVDQVIRGRMVMFAAELVTCASIVVIARRFVTRSQAMLCVLAYLSVGHVVQHGFAFRTDPLAAALAMSALAILTRARLGWIAITGFALLTGAAFMVTMKVVLLGPAFAGLAWLRWSEQRFSAAQAMRTIAAAALSLVAAGLIYMWHGMGIAPPLQAGAMLNRSGEAMFFLGAPDNWRYLVGAALSGVPFIMVLAALVWSLASRSDFTRDERIALAALALPLACVFFYFNVYPYFFAFILAPVAAGLAGAMPLLAHRYGQGKVAFLLLASGVTAWAMEDESRLNEQRAIQQAVAQMFPQRISYFDFAGFLPEHSKANFFMTRWGFRNYAAGVVPTFSEVMAQQPVPLLAAVDRQPTSPLSSVMRGELDGPWILPADGAALRSTYRQVWGPLYVAGTVLGPDDEREWNVLVPGTYTVEGSLSVDGNLHLDGALVTLDRGPVKLAATDEEAGLLWGDHLKAPTTRPPERPYWSSF